MNLESEDARDLVLARDGNVAALHQLYGRRSLAFLSTLGVRGSDAEDVLQKSWLSVIEHLRKKPFTGSFRAWLFQILRNTATDAFRKRRPEPLHPTTAEQTSDGQLAPDALLIEEEYMRAIQDCVRRLPELLRNLVVARMTGEAYDTISDRLQVDVARAHRLFFDAKKSLTLCLEAKGFQSEDS